MFVVHTTIPLDPDQRERALSLTDDLATAARELPGVRRYRPAIARGACRLQFFELYEDADAVAAKETLPEYDAFASALPELTTGELETVQAELDEPPAVVQFEATDAVPEN